VKNKLYALGRLKAGEMNKTEAAYALELEAQKQAGDILWYVFEGITLKLAPDVRYTPDFFLMHQNGELECREVKSRWIGDAKPKIRIAANQFPFRFTAIYAIPKREGGGWRSEAF
jgi:hypothetical protein